MTTEVQAAIYGDPPEYQVVAEETQLYPAAYAEFLRLENDDLRRRNERLRKEADEYRQLLVELRKKVAEVMHSSLDDFK